MSLDTTGVEAARSPLHFGIDLGTTNSAIAVFDPDDQIGPRILKVDNAETMPSVVSVDEQGNFAVGTAAANRALAAPGRVALSVKRQMGSTSADILLGETAFTPTEISARILARLADAVYSTDGEFLGGRPYHVVICVPANFMQDQKEETKKAAEMAGLNCVALLEEPVAAAIAYAMRGRTDQTILVYDFGGGTLDVSVLQAVSDGKGGIALKVKGTSGNPSLGGDDLDQKIIDLALDRLAESGGPRLNMDGTHEEISKATVRAALQLIKNAAVAAKHELTTMDETTILIPNLIKDQEGTYHSLDFTLTRPEFEAMVKDLIDSSLPCIDGALKEAGVEKDEVDKVVLAGGTTRMPLVRATLAEYMGKEPWADQSVDTAIARGAAIECDDLFKPSQVVEIENVVTHYLGIKLANGAFDVLIPKGAEIPPEEGVSTTKTYANESDRITTLTIRLYQSDLPVPQIRLSQDLIEDMVRDHGKEPTLECIGEFQVPIEPGPAGTVPVDVTMTIDSTNMLTVTGRSSKGGEEFTVDRRGVR